MYASGMDWKQLITELRARGLTLQAIGEAVGMTRGGVHDLTTGRGKSVLYETGVRLVSLHKKVMRRKVKTGENKE